MNKIKIIYKNPSENIRKLLEVNDQSQADDLVNQTINAVLEKFNEKDHKLSFEEGLLKDESSNGEVYNLAQISI